MTRNWVLAMVLALQACAPIFPDNSASRAIVAQLTLPPMKTFKAHAPKPVALSNKALARDFLDLSFQLEGGTPLPVLTRFEAPLTLRVSGRPPGTFNVDLQALLARLRAEAGLDISVTQDTNANIVIETTTLREIQKVLPHAACFVVPNVASLAEYKRAWRNPKTSWARLKTRTRSLIVIPGDVSPQEARDCLHEELAQALGPLNDLYRLPNSVFNDDNVHAVLTQFDMLMLRATYAPELASGMSRQEVAARLPAIFARINPNGQFGGGAAPSQTPQAYAAAIQTAQDPDTGLAERQDAANSAVEIAKNAGWTDTRRGFAHYARARVFQATDAKTALAEFQRADGFYARTKQTQLHRAHISTQLAAYALANGDAIRARKLVTPYIPQARAAQNAALLAILQLLLAEALNAENRIAEADAQRLDSLGWARYGFGADWAVETKLREIAAPCTAAPPV